MKKLRAKSNKRKNILPQDLKLHKNEVLRILSVNVTKPAGNYV